MEFFVRSKGQRAGGTSETERRKAAVTMTGRDYSGLKDCDTPLKFWLSEELEKRLEEMCDFVDTSVSDMIRQILFIHLYGRYDLFGLIERQDATFQLKRRVCFSEELEGQRNQERPLPDAPKNIADLKIWVPAQMREDLEIMAQRAGLKLSAYVRQALTTHLLGAYVAAQEPSEREGTNLTRK